ILILFYQLFIGERNMLDNYKLPDVTHSRRAVTTALNIQGWSHLDPILLAALAIESPLLLVGPHGTAKSLLVERLAMALRLSMRHYNAALINYDDLVGLPLPDKETETLKFFPTPSTIWDAGFVFFDEISRCRPDLQNKLYPIIHERRVVGIKLDKLHHRWSAMNPPAPEDPNLLANSGTYYLGSEPLDPALTDRFPFVVMVPNWSNLTKEERRAWWHGTKMMPQSIMTSVWQKWSQKSRRLCQKLRRVLQYGSVIMW
ncbi:MAG TPA: MoxR family ATPase, partial [Aggregatilineales bacterium]|nr:MoxR family ATPase [Aggregatilineales bacterium]